MKSFISVAALVAISAAHVSHPDRRDRCKNDACQQAVNLPLCTAFQIRTVYQTTSTVYISRSAPTHSSSTRSPDDSRGRPSVTRSSDDSSVSLVPRKDGKGKDDKSRHGGNDDSPSSSDDNSRASPTPTPPTVSASKTEDNFDDGPSATPEVPSEVAPVCKGKSDVKKACECIGVPTGTTTLSGTATVTRTKLEDRPSASASPSASTLTVS